MKTKSKKYAQALYHALLAEKASGHDRIFNNFVKLLSRYGLLSKTKWILSEFVEYYYEREGIARISLVSIRELEGDELEYIVKKLEKAIGKKVEVSVKVDPGILGGIVMRMGDTIYDGSLKTRLASLLYE